MNKNEQYVLEVVTKLRSQQIPIVPLAVAVRSGIDLAAVTSLLESLRAKGYLGDAADGR